MIKQKIYIIDFNTMFNILDEIKNILPFQVINYINLDIFLKSPVLNQTKANDFLIITKKKNKNKFLKETIDIKSCLFFEDLPLELIKIIEKINVQLIKKKYDYQSKMTISKYIINLNSRTITKDSKQLKLTEKEIDIILFLNENKKPQSIEKLQNEVWGYSSDLETHTVETHVYRLRKKIKNSFSDSEFILSCNDGYMIK
ncbi:winged helix-turn-helix domain-containing protein [Candidatus Pelagibacter sp.]|nr:winged helix-turn-helix domain-containing protein [Candidatus Pelagibacter sp.]